MTDIAIRAEAIGKLYKIGVREKYYSIRERLTDLAATPFRYACSLMRSYGSDASALTRDDSHIWALKDVSFEIRRGEVVGVIGRNGAGKSTLLKILSRITEPTEGKAEVDGRVRSLLEVGTGFHPELTGRENIFLNGAILGMKRAEIKKQFDEIVAFAEVDKFIDTPVKRYSSGMYVRLAFAVAAHLQPEVLLVDEVLAVGDFHFQKKCLAKIGDVAKQGRTVLLVSHNMPSIMNLCSRAIMLSDGKVAADAPAAEVVQHYLSTCRTTSAAVTWMEHKAAPGNEKVRVHSVRVLNPRGEAVEEHDIQEDVFVEIQFWNLKEGNRFYTALNLRDHMGSVVLGTNSMPSANLDPDPLWNEPLSIGLYKSVCRVPGNFLNDISYSIDAIVGTNVSHTELCLENVITFHVVDTGLMRKEHPGPWHGLVRIRMNWKTERDELCQATLLQ